MSVSERKCFLEEQTQRFPEVPRGDQRQRSSSGKPLELMKPSSPIATILDIKKKKKLKVPLSSEHFHRKVGSALTNVKDACDDLGKTFIFNIISYMLLDLKMPACGRLRSLLFRVLVAREVSSLISEKKSWIDQNPCENSLNTDCPVPLPSTLTHWALLKNYVLPLYTEISRGFLKASPRCEFASLFDAADQTRHRTARRH